MSESRAAYLDELVRRANKYLRCTMENDDSHVLVKDLLAAIVSDEHLCWQPIDNAWRGSGHEILGIKYNQDTKVMHREPFVSFWSPTMGKFYCDPTHWIPLPALPGPRL